MGDAAPGGQPKTFPAHLGLDAMDILAIDAFARADATFASLRYRERRVGSHEALQTSSLRNVRYRVPENTRNIVSCT